MRLTLLFIGVLSIFGVRSQDDELCEPKAVENLNLSSSLLTWQPASNDNCTPTNYLVYILRDGSVEYLYDVNSVSMDVSFIDICTEYIFSVIPVTDHVLGTGSSILNEIRPPDLPYEVTSLNLTDVNGTYSLEWTVETDVEKCIDLYRLVIWDEDGFIPHDVYITGTSYNVSDKLSLTPCMTYQFGVRAIYSEEEEGPVTLLNFTSPAEVTTPPRLTEINQGSNFINTTWTFARYEENRCNISQVTVKAPAFFNVSYDVVDTPRRLPFNINLNNLQPNTVYLSYVSVVNTAGPSDPLTVALQTTPEEDGFH